eukprot:UC1_evm1s1950
MAARLPVLAKDSEVRRSMEDLSKHSPKESPAMIRRGSQQVTGGDQGEWRMETGEDVPRTTDRNAFMSSVLLENPESETRWYFKFFLGNQHYNYLTHLISDGVRRLVIMSVLYAEDAPPSASSDGNQTRVILWQSAGSEHLLIPEGKTKERGLLSDLQRLFAAFGRGSVDKKIEELTDPAVQKQLLVLEEQEGAVNFKIGILLALKGQTTDDEMFGNEEGTPEYDKFCDLMGDKIELSGFTGYRGGLDVKHGSTGTHAVHTVEYGKEIMFHVSTLLPYTKGDLQQLERKRHLGNDICNIIYFQDYEDLKTFDPRLIKSRFNHIFACVARNKRGHYVVRVCTKSTVLKYGPSLPNPAAFADPSNLRRFLIVKMLNGEKAALASPTSEYGAKKMRTLEALIKSLMDQNSTSSKVDPKMVRVKKRATNRQNRSSQLMQGTNHFRQEGQAIKVGKIVDGVAPTSQMASAKGAAGTDAQREPWLPLAVTSSFPYRVVCGDQWNSDLVVGSTAGVFRVEVAAHKPGELGMVKLIDNSFPIQALSVDKNIGVIVLLSSKSYPEIGATKISPGTLYAVPLQVVGTLKAPLNKKSMKAYAVPETKGAHIFQLALDSFSTTASLLRQTTKLAVGLGKKLRTFQFVAKNPANVPGQGSGGNFIVLEEYSCGDIIRTMSVGSSESGSPTHVCLGLATGSFIMVDLLQGTSSPVISDGKLEPIDALDIPTERGQPQEFLLTYNQISVFRDTAGKQTRPFDINWPTRPTGVAYVYPYLLGFTTRGIQIFTLINGSIVKSLSMPDVSFVVATDDVFFTSKAASGDLAIYRIARIGLSGKATEQQVSELPEHIQGTAYTRKMSTSLFSTDMEMLGQFRRQANRSLSSPMDFGIEEGVTE